MDSGLSNPLMKDVGKSSEFYVSVDSNFVFYLNSIVTRRILFLMCLIMATFLVGDIDGMSCMADNEEIDADTFGSFCWTHGTYVIEELLNTTNLIKEVTYPGVGTLQKWHSPLYFRAYPWLLLYFWFLSASFEFMWWLWTYHFGGFHLIRFFKDANNVVMAQEEMIKLKNAFVGYLILTRHRHKAYAFKYSLCEVLNMVHLCLQVWFADWLMNGGFSLYGYEVISYYISDLGEEFHPRIKYFPRVTKCDIPISGPAGSPMNYSGICVMALHAIAEKMFAFLWFWYALLFIVNTIGLLYRLAVLYVPALRLFLLRVKSRRVNPTLIQTICKFSDYGDWYYIFSIRNSVKCWVFDEILTEYGERLGILDE